VNLKRYPKSLSYDPKKADTLFNLGIVKWQGEKDGPGAVAAWKKLLETNPANLDRDAVLQLMAQAQQRLPSFLLAGDFPSLAVRSGRGQSDEWPRE
jgi:hypothetical protein